MVNAIQSIDATGDDTSLGLITVEVGRLSQPSLPGVAGRKGPLPQEPIRSFRIEDNGIGFDRDNMASFETLDSEYKADQGCRGVGRLLWLKAFDTVEITSVFRSASGRCLRRSFSFTAAQGVSGSEPTGTEEAQTGATVTLAGFRPSYRDASAKTAQTIARSLLEHCLWYFVRPGGCPEILLMDGTERISLSKLFEDYMLTSAEVESLAVRGRSFDVVHLRVQARAGIESQIHWCAANRVVVEEKLADKVPGLHGRLGAGESAFVYSCYVTSPFLDEVVRSERTGFDLLESTEGTLLADELSLSEIRTAVLRAAERYLGDLLDEAKQAGRARVEEFVDHRAPRYRPILRHIDPRKLFVDPDISERDLELLLHRQLWDIEADLLDEGHRVLAGDVADGSPEHRKRLDDYLARIDDVKKSDLAAYVSRRRVVLDVLAKAIQADKDGRYVREDVIHKLIMPMRTTSNDVPPEVCNLWIIDERLAFHNFLASDKPLSSFPITDSTERKEPDLLALQVCDTPVLVSEKEKLPLAAITVVEIKRPMRADSKQDSGPVWQALGYLNRVRRGEVKTAQGRLIPAADDTPGFLYVVADLTPAVIEQCNITGLKRTRDGMGFFGYNDNYRAYIEVSSFDRLLNSAHERNRAFFDKLGLPV
ncbi:hypothetical protein [Actinoplanes sp. RD1]|uniref:hypothetical protein n=1 Tax=Actinoplanes sp. RD1 TaxID=3064538 RepID=UPI002741DBB3|nr:hypothetical protein [Actinoplanes sp. RD1]